MCFGPGVPNPIVQHFVDKSSQLRAHFDGDWQVHRIDVVNLKLWCRGVLRFQTVLAWWIDLVISMCSAVVRYFTSGLGIWGGLCCFQVSIFNLYPFLEMSTDHPRPAAQPNWVSKSLLFSLLKVLFDCTSDCHRDPHCSRRPVPKPKMSLSRVYFVNFLLWYH